MNYIITNNPEFFHKISDDFNFCNLEDMILGETLAVDTETCAKVIRKGGEQDSLNARHGKMFSVQIGTGIDNYLIDMQPSRTIDKVLGYEGRKSIDFQQVIPYLEHRTLIFHNAQFDLQFMYAEEFFPRLVQDTFLASKIMWNGIKMYRHDFGSVFERELGVIYDKQEQKNINVVQLTTLESIKYCWQDVDRLEELLLDLWVKMVDDNCIEAYELTAQYSRVLAYIQMCGLPVSKEMWLKKMALDDEAFAESQQEIIEYIYDNLPVHQKRQTDMFSDEKNVDVKITSPKQMIEVFDQLGINTYSHDGKRSIKEDVITKTVHEFIPIWLKYQSAKHTCTTFGETALKQIEDGIEVGGEITGSRIYPNFNPLLDTSRISTRKGSLNVLNLPANERTRSCFQHEEGYKYIVADVDGQENVCSADITGDEVMRRAILEGLDLHSEFARTIFPEIAHCTDQEVKTHHDDKRTAAKAPRFALAYGGSAITIANSQGIPIEEAEAIEEAYKIMHSGIYAWGDKKLIESLKDGIIRSCLGFKLYLPFFEDFIESSKRLDELDNDFWNGYRKGKKQQQALWDYKDFVENPTREDPEDPQSPFKVWEGQVPGIVDRYAHSCYSDNRRWISKHFQQRSRYQRLVLNNPVQCQGSMGLKKGLVMLLDRILDEGHQWKVGIAVVVHDEGVLHVKEELAEMYKPILEECLSIGGTYVNQSSDMVIEATAGIGRSWYTAKSGG